MTRHGSTRTRPPYQATTISQSATQLQQHNLHRFRNPWAPGDSQSTTNSSTSSRTYHGIPSDGVSSPIYHYPLSEEHSNIAEYNESFDSYNHRSILPELDPYRPERNKPFERQYFRNELDSYPGRVYPEPFPERRYFNHEPESDLMSNRYQEIDTRQISSKEKQIQVRNYLDEHGRLAYQQPIPRTVQSYVPPVTTSGSASERAQSPNSLTGRGAVEGCGGHCIEFQNFCYYFLQVIFVIGILTGVSLCIEGSAVRRNRGKDLSVLVYIGCLISMVCGLLLSIQYCVRRKVQRRKKALRLALNTIPLGDIPLQHSPVTLVPPATMQHQFQMDSRNGYNRDTFRSGMSTVPFVNHTNEIPDQNGIPWWRRDPIRQ